MSAVSDCYLQIIHPDGTKSIAFMSLPDGHDDFVVMQRAFDFKYAARRQNKLFVVDMVARWKRPLLWLLGIKVQP